jgi:hypothetical protein
MPGYSKETRWFKRNMWCCETGGLNMEISTEDIEKLLYQIRDIRRLCHQMIDEFPRIPEDTSSSIIVQDFISDLKAWKEKWIKK